MRKTVNNRPRRYGRLPAAKWSALATLLFASGLRTANASLAAEFDIQPRALHVGEAAIASLTVRGVESPPAPSLDGIQGFQVRMAGTERSWSFGTDGRDSAITFRYQLVPLQTGTFTIGPFAYQAGGETVQLPAIELQVVAEGAERGRDIGDVLFAALTTRQTNFYSQQVFDVDLSVFAREGLNTGNEVALMNLPAAGLAFQPFQEMSGGQEVINHRIYNVRRYRSKVQALTAGRFELAPTVRVQVLVKRERRRQTSFFDDPFFGNPLEAFFGGVQAQPVDIVPKPLPIEVQSLPAPGQPAGFAGAVGWFLFDAQVKPAVINLGDPVTLTMRIEGEGNIENIGAPVVQPGDAFKTYEPKLVVREIDEAHATGRKVFEQVLIPTTAEVTSIPPIRFCFFNPSKGGYESATIGPFPLLVHATSNRGAHAVSAAAPVARDVKLLGTDIVYLKPAPRRWHFADEQPFFLRRFFLYAQLLPPALLAALVLATRRRETLAHDVTRARRLQAPRSARSALRRAEQAIGAGDHAAFYQALSEALLGYFGNRLNLPPGRVDADTVAQALAEANPPPALSHGIRSIFHRCEEQRFGSAGGKGEGDEDAARALRELLSETSRLLRECERLSG
jgi:hypothetical protein